MSLPEQFNEENIQNIRIYHYIEEIVSDYRYFMKDKLENGDISIREAPLLIRITFTNNSTQQDIARALHFSEGYTARILKGFEEKGLISRVENPKNRRQKIVSLTPKGVTYSNHLVSLIDEWEQMITKDCNKKETEQLKESLYKILKNRYTGD